jgi:tRNA modification GTPase
VVESQLVVGGIPIQVLDTAGIRETSDKVEKIGVERSLTSAQGADLVLLTIDAAAGWTEADADIYTSVQHRPVIVVINKIDLVETQPQLPDRITLIVETAAAQNRGIEALEQAILTTVQTGSIKSADMDLAINQRQAAALTRAKISLQQVIEAVTDTLPLDFWTIDLRGAIQALGEITGEEVTESVLDRIFSRFCIGK